MSCAGPEGFEGGISAGKYGSIPGASKATATRDLADLLRAGALGRLPGGGRSTRYELALGEKA
jgi:Fic family protein